MRFDLEEVRQRLRSAGLSFSERSAPATLRAAILFNSRATELPAEPSAGHPLWLLKRQEFVSAVAPLLRGCRAQSAIWAGPVTFHVPKYGL